MEVKAAEGPVHGLCPVSEALVLMLHFRPLGRHSSSHTSQDYPEVLSNAVIDFLHFSFFLWATWNGRRCLRFPSASTPERNVKQHGLEPHDSVKQYSCPRADTLISCWCDRREKDQPKSWFPLSTGHCPPRKWERGLYFTPKVSRAVSERVPHAARRWASSRAWPWPTWWALVQSTNSKAGFLRWRHILVALQTEPPVCSPTALRCQHVKEQMKPTTEAAGFRSHCNMASVVLLCFMDGEGGQ